MPKESNIYHLSTEIPFPRIYVFSSGFKRLRWFLLILNQYSWKRARLNVHTIFLGIKESVELFWHGTSCQGRYRSNMANLIKLYSNSNAFLQLCSDSQLILRSTLSIHLLNISEQSLKVYRYRRSPVSGTTPQPSEAIWYMCSVASKPKE